MANDTKIIEVVLDDNMKTNLTQQQISKLQNEIKSALRKFQKIKITVEKV